MSLAKSCGLNVPNIHVQEIDGRTVYLIERFDRDGKKRTGFVSGLTLTGTHESDFTSWSYFSLVDAIIKGEEKGRYFLMIGPKVSYAIPAYAVMAY